MLWVLMRLAAVHCPNAIGWVVWLGACCCPTVGDLHWPLWRRVAGTVQRIHTMGRWGPWFADCLSRVCCGAISAFKCSHVV